MDKNELSATPLINELELAGYEVSEDPDQPRRWLWRNEPDNTACEVSFDSEIEAWTDALHWALT